MYFVQHVCSPSDSRPPRTLQSLLTEDEQTRAVCICFLYLYPGLYLLSVFVSHFAYVFELQSRSSQNMSKPVQLVFLAVFVSDLVSLFVFVGCISILICICIWTPNSSLLTENEQTSDIWSQLKYLWKGSRCQPPLPSPLYFPNMFYLCFYSKNYLFFLCVEIFYLLWWNIYEQASTAQDRVEQFTKLKHFLIKSMGDHSCWRCQSFEGWMVTFPSA